MTELELPIIIGGQRIDNGDKYDFEYETGVTVRIPKVTTEMISRMRKQDRMTLHDMTVAEVSEFLGKVGDLWRDVNYPCGWSASSMPVW